MRAVSGGLSARRIAQPDHQVRLKRRRRSEPDVPGGVVLAGVGRAPLPARPQLVDRRVSRGQTAAAVGGVLRVLSAIGRRIPDRRSVRHRGPGRARHREGRAVVRDVRGGPSLSPPVRDESIADAVAGHVGAEDTSPSTSPCRPAPARRSRVRRSSARPAAARAAAAGSRWSCRRRSRSRRSHRWLRHCCRRLVRRGCRRFLPAQSSSIHMRQVPERPRRRRFVLGQAKIKTF